MAVKSFATNYLVADHDMYKEFMDKRFEYMKKNNIETDVLFCNTKRDITFLPNGKNSAEATSSYVAILKWHCMTISYSIWCELVSPYMKEDNRVANYKKFVNVPIDILKKFKYRVERSIENAGCDYNKKINSGHGGGNLDACRYLSMFWTYLDLKKDCKTQRYFPDLETIQRAARVFGYADKENPFEMNGRFTKRAIRNVSEEKPMEQTEQNVDIRSIKIEDLELSMRTYNVLKLARINTLGDILDKTYDYLSKVRNLGLHSLREIEAKLNEYGYGFSGDGVIRPNVAPKESVIDIAEEAAKKVEEEEKLNSVEMVHPYDYNALLEKYNKLKDDYDKLDVENVALFRDKNDLTSYNSSLREEIEKLKDNIEELRSREMELNLVANPKNLDTFALLKTVLEKMSDSKMEYILVTIGGMVIDIHPKQNSTIRMREAGYGRV